MPKEVQPSLLGLRSIKLLEGLPDERLAALARECAWRRYAADQRIIARDAPDRDVYLLVAGRVRVTTYSSAGKQVTFSDEAAGEIFGDMAAIDGEPRSADVIALDEVLIASMSPAAFRRLLAQEPILAERVMRHLAGLVRRLSERVIDLSTLGVQNRIHAEILRLAREAGISPGLTQFLPRITAQAATSKARRTNSGLKPCRCASGAPCPGCACAAPVRKDRIKASRIFVSSL